VYQCDSGVYSCCFVDVTVTQLCLLLEDGARERRGDGEGKIGAMIGGVVIASNCSNNTEQTYSVCREFFTRSKTTQRCTCTVRTFTLLAVRSTTHNDMSAVDSTLLYMLAASSQNGPTDLDAIWSVPSVL